VENWLVSASECARRKSFGGRAPLRPTGGAYSTSTDPLTVSNWIYGKKGMETGRRKGRERGRKDKKGEGGRGSEGKNRNREKGDRRNGKKWAGRREIAPLNSFLQVGV